MAAPSLLALIDDIATLLDDVAILSKVAMKKTAGVLGDDLALNAQQVAGVRADRELPVVWAVAKGSFKNKLILVPAALLISAFAPWAITILLVIGGAYLCYEGVEKLAHKFLHPADEKQAKHREKLQALSDPTVDMVAFEQEKIKGAVRTDFILSAEIIVISLGAVKDAEFAVQVAVVSGLAVAITIGVYGIVAGIVRLDDVGLSLSKATLTGIWSRFKRSLGRLLLLSAPYLMKTLSIVGTIAMFLVGGGILVHSLPVLHHFLQGVTESLHALIGLEAVITSVMPVLLDGFVGIILGVVVLLVVSLTQRLINLIRRPA